MKTSGNIDRVDVRARLVVGQVFRVGETRFGIVRERRTDETGILLSVDYVCTAGKHRIRSIRSTRLEGVAGSVTAFATRAEFDLIEAEGRAWIEEQRRLYNDSRRAKRAEVVSAVPEHASSLADLERRVALIEGTVCKYLLSLIKDSDADGSAKSFLEANGGLRAQ